jgi:hypothetical protein
MKVIPPIALNTINITTTAPVDSNAEWNTSTTYDPGDYVKVTGTVQKVYLCTLQANSTVDSPELDVLRSVPHWVEVGPTNEYAMFDLLRSTKTIASTQENNDITVTITPGQSVNSLACLGLDGVLTAVVTAERSSNPGVSVYSNTFNLNLRFTNSWYTYFYGAFREKTAFVLFDLPSQYSDLIITIVFRGLQSFEIGACVVGNYKDIGNVQNGASVDVLNFSNVDRDSYGTTQLVPRRNVPKTNQTLYFNKNRLTEVITIKTALDAVPAVWSGLDDQIDDPYFDALLILGFYRRFDLDINNPIIVYCSLELEEI